MSSTDGKAADVGDVNIKVEVMKQEPVETSVKSEETAGRELVVTIKEEIINPEFSTESCIGTVLDVETKGENLEQQVTDTLHQAGFAEHIRPEVVSWIVDNLRSGQLPDSNVLSTALQAPKGLDSGDTQGSSLRDVRSNLASGSHLLARDDQAVASLVQDQAIIHDKQVEDSQESSQSGSDNGSDSEHVNDNDSNTGTDRDSDTESTDSLGIGVLVEDRMTPASAIKSEVLSNSSKAEEKTLTASVNVDSREGKVCVCVCCICKEELPSPALLTKHMIHSHTDKTTQKCPLCGKRLSSRASLRAHIPIHTGEKSHICSECGKAFNNPSTLIKHFRTHTGNRPFICQFCEKSFTYISHLKRHKEVHMNQNLKCFVCKTSFKDKESLRVHKRSHFMCSFCKKGFCDAAYLREHMLQHNVDKDFSHSKVKSAEKKFICTICGKGFSWSGHVKRHMMTHTESKPFQCSECGKRFSLNHDLEVHERIHRGEYPYPCSSCSKRFRTGSNLNKHFKKAHSH